MEQLQNNGVLELVRYMTQQNVSTLTETVQSSRNEPSEFQKELEQQTKTAQRETAQAAEQPKAEQAEQKAEAPVKEEENAKQTLETEQAVMQQLIAAGVVNITPVNETATVQEAPVELAVEATVNTVQAEPEGVVAAQTAMTAEQPTVVQQEQVNAPQTEQSGQPVETEVQGPVTVQERQPQAELQPRQDGGQQGPEFTAKTETAPQTVERDEVEVTNAAEGAQPLFEQVDEIPVKVGETDAPQPATQTTNVEEQVEVKLTEALEQGESKLEIQLTPEYLGTIKVELTRSADGTLHIVLNAENGQTGSLLEKHSANLQNLLMANGQERVQVEVQNTQENQQHPQQDLADGRNGNQQNGQQQSRREPQDAQDFLQQLRLGLIPADEEES